MYYAPLTRQQQNACLQEIGYSRDQLDVDIGILRKWLNEQFHLPPSRLKESDGFLRSFLLGCKGSLEKCKRKLDNYYSFRSTGCPFFGNYDPTSVSMEVKNVAQFGFLPNSLDDGTRILVFKPNGRLTRKRFLSCFQAVLMSLELELRREDIWPASIVYLNDFIDVPVSEVLKLSPFYARDLFYILQEILPFRIKQLIYMNVTPTLAVAANYLVKPFISKKITSRVQVISTGLETVTEFAPTTIAPKEIGGVAAVSLESINDEFYETVEKKRDWFVNELSEKVDENKRPSDSYGLEHPNFGPEGTFKALLID